MFLFFNIWSLCCSVNIQFVSSSQPITSKSRAELIDTFELPQTMIFWNFRDVMSHLLYYWIADKDERIFRFHSQHENLFSFACVRYMLYGDKSWARNDVQRLFIDDWWLMPRLSNDDACFTYHLTDRPINTERYLKDTWKIPVR